MLLDYRSTIYSLSNRKQWKQTRPNVMQKGFFFQLCVCVVCSLNNWNKTARLKDLRKLHVLTEQTNFLQTAQQQKIFFYTAYYS